MESLGFIYLWENTHPEARKHTKYIGQHIGTVDDGYIGGGVIFVKKFYCKKYRGFWKRKILQFCSNEYDLNEAEKKWINKHNALNDPLFCNIREGGDNGRHSAKTKQKIKKSIKQSGRVPWNKGITGVFKQSEITKNKRRESFKRHFEPIRQARKEYVLKLIIKNGSVKVSELQYEPGFTLKKAANIIKEMRDTGAVKMKYFGLNDVRYVKT
jgi:hypothetical protein